MGEGLLVVQCVVGSIQHGGSVSYFSFQPEGERCSSVVRAFAHGVMGQWLDPSWWTH